jgi:hypothetical protein
MSNTKKFIFIFKGSQPYQSEEEANKSIQDWNKWIGELIQSDTFVSGEQLESDVKTLKGKKKELLDGPFTETKEIVSGVMTVKAKDIDEATEIAKGCPIFDFDGTVEVRPLMELN